MMKDRRRTNAGGVGRVRINNGARARERGSARASERVGARRCPPLLFLSPSLSLSDAHEIVIGSQHARSFIENTVSRAGQRPGGVNGSLRSPFTAREYPLPFTPRDLQHVLADGVDDPRDVVVSDAARDGHLERRAGQRHLEPADVPLDALDDQSRKGFLDLVRHPDEVVDAGGGVGYDDRGRGRGVEGGLSGEEARKRAEGRGGREVKGGGFSLEWFWGGFRRR